MLMLWSLSVVIGNQRLMICLQPLGIITGLEFMTGNESDIAMAMQKEMRDRLWFLHQ